MSPTTSTPIRTEFLGLAFDTLDIDAVITRLADERGGPFGYVITPNVDHLVRLADAGERGEADVLAAYAGADLMLCDSRVLALLARARGVDLPVVPGSDLTARLFGEVLTAGDSITIVGADAATRATIEDRYPGIVVHQHIPPMRLRTNPRAMDDAARFVAEHPARFHFLAVGSPQQELLAHAIATRGDARGWGLCIGASIDFLSGRQTRAPRWLQRLGLEWSHRLFSDPRRMWRRYLVEGPRIFRMTARWRPPTHR